MNNSFSLCLFAKQLLNCLFGDGLFLECVKMFILSNVVLCDNLYIVKCCNGIPIVNSIQLCNEFLSFGLCKVYMLISINRKLLYYSLYLAYKTYYTFVHSFR